jgi:hypothetical protein
MSRGMVLFSVIIYVNTFHTMNMVSCMEMQTISTLWFSYISESRSP